jgi:MYXO-CTERM domain-containing protein
MKFNHGSLLGALSLVGSCVSSAAIYVDNFESIAFLDDMTAPSVGWSSNDPTANVGKIVNAQNAGGTFGSRSGSIGYVAPILASSAYVSRAVSTPLVGGGVNAYASVDFFIQDSDAGEGPGAEARDKFGFRFEDGSGNNIFSLFLNPFDQDSSPQTDVAYHTLSWSTGNNIPTVVLPGVAVQENTLATPTSPYTFAISFTPSGANDVAFNATIGGSSFGGTLAGLATTNIEKFGAFWTPLNGPANPGSNFMIFDNVSVIPEPSAALLGLLGATVAFTRRRRA